jgi:Domain of unknown function (DUF4864)
MAKWFGLVIAAVLLATPVAAQSEAPSIPDASAPAVSAPDAAAVAEWQGVVHSQIQAFRDHDGAAALSYAAAAFHELYKDPSDFLVAILNAGYAPIMESRSDSFGPYQMLAPDVVDQDVKFVGNDQSLYEAIYRLQKEAGGWRVEAVQLVKKTDVGA